MLTKLKELPGQVKLAITLLLVLIAIAQWLMPHLGIAIVLLVVLIYGLLTLLDYFIQL